MYARGIDRRVLFLDDVDRDGYFWLLAKVIARQGWRCLSYCLMDNHLHLMIETPQANLGDGMQRLHGTFAQQLNRRHGRAGHVFQGRFGSKCLKTESHLWATTAYIAANPVDAGMCSAPEEWQWSSHAATSADGQGPPWLDTRRLFALLSAFGENPRRRYRELVSERCAAARSS